MKKGFIKYAIINPITTEENIDEIVLNTSNILGKKLSVLEERR